MDVLTSAKPARRAPAWALGGFVLGAALQLQQPALLHAGLYATLTVVALLVLALLALRRVRGVWADVCVVRLAAVLLLFLMLGFGLTGLRAVIFQSGALAPALEGRDMDVTGTVLAMPQRSDDGLRFRFAIESARLDGLPVRLPPRVYLGWYAGFGVREPASAIGGPDNPEAGDGPALTLALQRQPAALRAGERWRLTVRLKAPHGNSNPHGFDYELWLWEQGLQAIGYVRAGPSQARMAPVGGSAAREAASVGAEDVRAGPSQARVAPVGGSAAREAASVGAEEVRAGLSQARMAPVGGSAAREAASVGAEEVRVGLRDRDPAPQLLSDSWRHPVERARQSLRDAVYARVSDRQLAGVVAALLVGDQNAIERSDWDVFRATGVAHLMSISGLHITMFAWLAAQGLGWLWRRSARWSLALCLAMPAVSAGAWGGLLLAGAYALLSGWGVPAQRTVWMLATVVVLRQSGKRWPWPQIWLLAMAVVVALDPWALLQAGFWLSFVAVGVLFAAGGDSSRDSAAGRAIESGADDARPIGARGIKGDMSGRWTEGLPLGLVRACGALLRMAREQWVVTLALAPLTLLLFNQVSLVGLLANSVAIPWVTLVVTPLTMLGVFWAPLWELSAGAVSALMVFLQWLARWPLASISVAAAPLWCAVAGVAGGLLLAMRLPWHWRVLGVPLLLPVLLWQPLRPAAGQFELMAADVGQGNALIVRTASHTLVYDAGPRFSRESDAGHRVLVPLLRALGENVDVLMLSHRDSDHIGGAPAVLGMQPQARLLSSIEDGHPLQGLRPSQRCREGQRWRWDGVEFEVLHPPEDAYETTQKSNAMSCVLRISSGAATALLAGDIELAQEQRLVAAGANLKADILLMPHHGSKTSSSPVFLDAVQPGLALAQAGYRNRFGHPAAPVLARYEERGIRVLASPACGAASWDSAQPARVSCQRQTGLRYWHHRTGD